MLKESGVWLQTNSLILKSIYALILNKVNNPIQYCHGYYVILVVRVGFSSSLLPVVIIIPSMVLLLFLFSVLLVTLFLCKRRRDKRLLISTVCWKCQGKFKMDDTSQVIVFIIQVVMWSSITLNIER